MPGDTDDDGGALKRNDALSLSFNGGLHRCIYRSEGKSSADGRMHRAETCLVVCG